MISHNTFEDSFLIYIFQASIILNYSYVWYNRTLYKEETNEETFLSRHQ